MSIKEVIKNLGIKENNIINIQGQCTLNTELTNGYKIVKRLNNEDCTSCRIYPKDSNRNTNCNDYLHLRLNILLQ